MREILDEARLRNVDVEEVGDNVFHEYLYGETRHQNVFCLANKLVHDNLEDYFRTQDSQKKITACNDPEDDYEMGGDESKDLLSRQVLQKDLDGNAQLVASVNNPDLSTDASPNNRKETSDLSGDKVILKSEDLVTKKISEAERASVMVGSYYYFLVL